MKVTYRAISLDRLCRLFGKSRQSYYKQNNRQQQADVRNQLVLERVREIRQHSHRMGTLKLRHILSREMGDAIRGLGRDAFFRLLRTNRLLIKPKKRYAISTQSDHRFKKWPDLVQRKQPERPEQLWVSDITYVRIKHRWLYLCLITDAFSRKIVGYKLTHSPTTKACLAALRMAINTRLYPEMKLMHHSDRGIQYCSVAYVNTLQAHDIAISMTASGSPYDNAVAERLNGILKHEYHMEDTFDDYSEALRQLVKAVDIYNNFRPHMSCNMLSPQEVHHSWKIENHPKPPKRRNQNARVKSKPSTEVNHHQKKTMKSKNKNKDNPI